MTHPLSDSPPLPVPTKRWSLSPLDNDRARFLARELQVDPIIGQLLVNRGMGTVEQAQNFLDRRLKALHDPADHPGIREAAERIHSAITAGRQICVYGDYDVDGMCASAILLECLRLAGAEPISYIPDRFEEGYGVNSQALSKLRAQGVDLVVTVDCGIASVAEADEARSIGLEYIVTDHHEMRDELPRADAVVHPRLPGSSYPFGHLCGTGVAFKLAWEVARRISGGSATTPAFKKFLLDATTLTAIGTVCDVVPLAGENRVFVHHGLLGLKQSPPIGLYYLMREAGLLEKARLEAEDIGFMLGPRLNACGRLGQARLGVELLTTRDNARAQELARYLNDRNAERQTMERRIFQEARDQADARYGSLREPPPVIVLASDEWHPGVIGIVASRMVERYHRPCILIAFQGDEGTGSGRSMRGVHLSRALSTCSEHLLTSGGHEMAAGLRIRRDQVDSFREALECEVREQTADESLVADVRIDLEVPLSVLSPKLVNTLEVMEPFGVSNPKPIFMATNLSLVGEPKTMGGGGRHLSFRVEQGQCAMRVVAFGWGEKRDSLVDGQGRCCLAFEPIINTYRGYPEVELKARDIRPGPTAD